MSNQELSRFVPGFLSIQIKFTFDFSVTGVVHTVVHWPFLPVVEGRCFRDSAALFNQQKGFLLSQHDLKSFLMMN